MAAFHLALDVISLPERRKPGGQLSHRAFWGGNPLQPDTRLSGNSTSFELPKQAFVRDAAYRRAYRQRRRDAGNPVSRGTDPHVKRFLGIDGEGRNRPEAIDEKGRSYTPQDYYLIAASDADGKYTYSDVALAGRITTERALEFILKLPADFTIAGFSLGYDLTKWLSDVPTDVMERLYHPDLRHTKDVDNRNGMNPAPVYWNGYALNWQGPKFTVRRAADKKGKSARTVWDVYRFFQKSALASYTDWLPTDPDLELVKEGKLRRGTEDKPDPKVELRYCLAECRMLAAMMEKLRSAAEEANYPLRQWFGAGSVASAMVKHHSVTDHIKEEPSEVARAVNEAYYGGRFEISAHGPIKHPVHEYDLCSAYPAATLTLPCLVHASWERSHTSKLHDGLSLVQVEWDCADPPVRWGPFPVRVLGHIVFPLRGFGWYWSSEVAAAIQLYGRKRVRVCQSWRLIPGCGERPFSWVPDAYAKRLEWGKSGPGVVLKLGLNAMYGKFAQRIGSRPFFSETWAGMITAWTRSKLLDAIRLAGQDSIIATATDAIYSLNELPIETPGKPLGGWEYKAHPDGFFLPRSGVLIPYKSDGEAKARGLSRKTVKELLPEFEQAWQANGSSGKVAVEMRAFLGNLSAVKAKDQGRRGCWYNRIVELQFNPLPKRNPALTVVEGIARSYPVIEMPRLNVARDVLSQERFWTRHDGDRNEAYVLDQPDHVELFPDA